MLEGVAPIARCNQPRYYCLGMAECGVTYVRGMREWGSLLSHDRLQHAMSNGTRNPEPTAHKRAMFTGQGNMHLDWLLLTQHTNMHT